MCPLYCFLAHDFLRDLLVDELQKKLGDNGSDRTRMDFVLRMANGKTDWTHESNRFDDFDCKADDTVRSVLDWFAGVAGATRVKSISVSSDVKDDFGPTTPALLASDTCTDEAHSSNTRQRS